MNHYAAKYNYASAKRNNKEDEDDRRKEEAAFNICSSLSVRKKDLFETKAKGRSDGKAKEKILVLIPETTFVGVESRVLIPETTFVGVESRVFIPETTFVGVKSRVLIPEMTVWDTLVYPSDTLSELSRFRRSDCGGVLEDISMAMMMILLLLLPQKQIQARYTLHFDTAEYLIISKAVSKIFIEVIKVKETLVTGDEDIYFVHSLFPSRGQMSKFAAMADLSSLFDCFYISDGGRRVARWFGFAAMADVIIGLCLNTERRKAVESTQKKVVVLVLYGIQRLAVANRSRIGTLDERHPPFIVGTGHFADACSQKNAKIMQKQEKEEIAATPPLPEPKVSLKYPEFVHFKTIGILDGTDKGTWDDFWSQAFGINPQGGKKKAEQKHCTRDYEISWLGSNATYVKERDTLTLNAQWKTKYQLMKHRHQDNKAKKILRVFQVMAFMSSFETCRRWKQNKTNLTSSLISYRGDC
ncbi:hypothetical protein Tco_0173956 [Tanacetum coccineum]